jgi:all-trans-8'-apo-beta-carotenal 15,15'-oxygenase
MDRRDFLRGAALTGGASLLTPEAVWAAAANDWTLGLADVEADVAPTAMTRLHGKAPAELKGTLFRNGPAKFRRPGGAVGPLVRRRRHGPQVPDRRRPGADVRPLRRHREAPQ